MREALIVWGGWSGHEPERCAGLVAAMLEEEGFKVHVENSTAAFADPRLADMSLVVPIYTTVEDREARGRQLDQGRARRRRLGRLPWRHVRCLSRSGRVSVHVRRPVGRAPGQHHRLPGEHRAPRRPRHAGASRTSITAQSSTTCMSTPRTRCSRRPPSPASTRTGSRASSCRWFGSGVTARGACSTARWDTSRASSRFRKCAPSCGAGCCGRLDRRSVTPPVLPVRDACAVARHAMLV